MNSNPNAMLTLKENCIFTNCALTPGGDVYWEDMLDSEPDRLADWLRRSWTPDSARTAAHPNARFTAPASQCPVIAKEWEDPAGVPISAILFGGRRATTVPLATEAFGWQHGTFLGSIMASEKTAAATGQIGVVRRDPMAMLPFCGYHMGDYFKHWLEMGAKGGAGDRGEWGNMPRVFYVNWFRKDESGRFLWPGFGENSRVLKWVFDRCDGNADAQESLIGLHPTSDSLDIEGLDISPEDLEELLAVDSEKWRQELALLGDHYKQFGERLPQALRQQLLDLEARLR